MAEARQEHSSRWRATCSSWTVPAGAYFVMGDYRDNSVDSRFPQASGGIGPVPFDNLIGRVDGVF